MKLSTVANNVKTFALIFILSQVLCIDPYDYEPDYPALIDPPAAPVLTYPAMNTYFESTTLPYTINLEWQYVLQAESYCIEVSIDSFFFGSIDDIESFSYDYSAPAYGKYYWRVRADSRAWKWYTGWSNINTFIIEKP
jgi:hypothetical protein